MPDPERVRRRPGSRRFVPLAAAVLLMGAGTAGTGWAQIQAGAVPAGARNNQITLTVRNGDDQLPMNNVRATVLRSSPELTNVAIAPQLVAALEPGQAQGFVLRFDVAPSAAVGTVATIDLAFTADSGTFDDPAPSIAVVIVPAPIVSACALRDDAPAVVDVENAVDYCDPERQPWEYDRVAVFFTPSRDVSEPVEDREPFLWRIVGPRGDTLGQGASGNFGPRLPEDSTPFAREGSPGRFVAVIDLWDRDDRPDPGESRRGPGTYTVQTAAGEYNSTGVLGQGETSVTRKVLSGLGEDLTLAAWEDDGTFEVASARLYFQGFVAERVADVALPARADIWEGQLTIDPPRVAGTTVSLEGRAWWRSASTRQGQRVPDDAIERAGSRLTLEFPEALAPGHRKMGTIGVRLTPVERGDLFFTGGMHLMIPTTRRPPDRPLVSGPTPVVWAAYGNTTGPGSGGDPFQRFEFEEPDPLAYGEFWVWPRGPVNRFAGEEAVELDGKLTLLSGKADQTAGEPERRLPAHLHDPDTIWVIPVFLTLTDDVTVRSRALAMRSYGYAIYAARRGTYTEPLPEGGPEAADAPAPGDEQPADAGAPANAGDPANPADPNRPRGDPGTRSGTGAIDPAAVDPERPDIAPLIREWLAVAEPPENADGASFRYDDWGRRIGSAAPGMGRTIGAAPPPDGGGSPVAFAWRQRAGLDSIDHCLLEEYVVARLEEASIAACAGRYPRTVATPDVSGLTLDEAVGRLRGQGLEIAPVLLGPAPSPDRARVVERQDPVAAGRARPGSTVTVWVHGDYQPAMLTVPDLGGQTLADAQRIASEAGIVLAPSLVGAAPAPELARRIAAQRPGASAAVAPGATVEVDVYGDYAAPGATVPQLVGLTLDEARSALEPLGLVIVPSLVGGAPRAEDAFRISAQSPATGTSLAAGGDVQVDLWGAYVPPSPVESAESGPAGTGIRPGIPEVRCPPFFGADRLAPDSPRYSHYTGSAPALQTLVCYYENNRSTFQLEWQTDPGERSASYFCRPDFEQTVDRRFEAILTSRSRRVDVRFFFFGAIDAEWARQVARELIQLAEPYAAPCSGSASAPTPSRGDSPAQEPRIPRWVLAETQVNPRNEPTEFVVGVTPNYYSARFQGSYERWMVTDTGMGLNRRWMDRQNLEMDVTVQVSFPRPPAELVPGQAMNLQATFSHQGTVNVGNPGIAFQYGSSGFRLTGESALTYAPFAATFDGRSSVSPTFVVPATGTGELRLEASLLNCGACHVIWVYRARQ